MQIEKSAAGIEVATELPFVMIKDGNGIENKVIDLDNLSLLPKTGQMVFESVRKNSRNAVQSAQYSCTKDKQSEVMVGICIGVNKKTGELRWLNMTLANINTFDLSVPIERKKAIVLLRSTIVEGSPNESMNLAVPRFRVHDAEKAANLNIKRVMDGQRAVLIATGLGGEDLYNMARNLGIMTERMSLPIITSEVLSRAEKNPQEFLQVWENPNRKLLTILNRCLNTGVITHDAMDGYHYEGRFLGHNEPAVFEYLKKYPDVATTLDVKGREKLKQSEKSMANEIPLRNRQDQADELLAAQKQIADLQAKLMDQSADSIRQKMEDEKTADPLLQNELEALKEEGAKLKIKALHLYRPTEDSIAKLKAKIDEAKTITA